MKKLNISLLLLFLIPLSGITNAMERDIPEGKQEIEKFEQFEKLDLLTFLQVVPRDIRLLIWSYIINADTLAQVYKNVRSILSTNNKAAFKQAALLFENDSFIKAFVDFLYEKFISPRDQLFEDEKIETFDRALMLALSLKNNKYALERLKQLLHRLVDEKAKQEFLQKIMANYIDNNRVAQLAFLIENIDSNLVNATFSGNTPLIRAINARHAAVVSWLLQKGVDVNSPNTSLDTPLMRAVETGNEDLESLLCGLLLKAVMRILLNYYLHTVLMSALLARELLL